MGIVLEFIDTAERVHCRSILVASVALGVLAKDVGLGTKGNGFQVISFFVPNGEK